MCDAVSGKGWPSFPLYWRVKGLFHNCRIIICEWLLEMALVMWFIFYVVLVHRRLGNMYSLICIYVKDKIFKGCCLLYCTHWHFELEQIIPLYLQDFRRDDILLMHVWKIGEILGAVWDLWDTVCVWKYLDGPVSHSNQPIWVIKCVCFVYILFVIIGL